jgi:glycosyltransferase involved in cell wall biosynthesis
MRSSPSICVLDLNNWQDELNCFKFDGSAQGLTQAIERSFSWASPLVPVRLRSDPWPWADWNTPVSSTMRMNAEGTMPEPPVSIVVPHFNLGRHLCEALENILSIHHRNIEIVVVDDASTDAGSAQVIETLARLDNPRLKVLRLPGNVGLAAARNIGVRHASGDYLLTLDADDLIDPEFVGRAVRALERCPEFDVVVTPAIYFPDGQAPLMRGAADAVDYAVFTGEARTAGLLENRFSTATALFRKKALERFRYDEALSCYEDWSLYMRMCDAGLRFLVTTDAYFFYRRRDDSMVHAPRTASARHVDYSDLLRTSAPASFRKGSMHLMLGLSSTQTRGVSSSDPGLAGSQIDELLHRTTHLEQMLQGVLHATTPWVKMFRIPRYFWRRLLPLRRLVVRVRGLA